MEKQIDPRRYVCIDPDSFMEGRTMIVTYDDGSNIVCHWDAIDDYDMNYFVEDFHERFRRIDYESCPTPAGDDL